MNQQPLPLVIPEYERQYHAFVPWSYSGAMDTPLGCKVCNHVLWHPVHGRTEGLYVSADGGEE